MLLTSWMKCYVNMWTLVITGGIKSSNAIQVLHTAFPSARETREIYQITKWLAWIMHGAEAASFQVPPSLRRLDSSLRKVLIGLGESPEELRLGAEREREGSRDIINFWGIPCRNIASLSSVNRIYMVAECKWKTDFGKIGPLWSSAWGYYFFMSQMSPQCLHASFIGPNG